MQEVSRGLVGQALVGPREVFQAAILANCTRILLIHAHPSGDATPSHQDHTLTQTLVQAGALLGIEVLDHVIIFYRSIPPCSAWGIPP